MENHLKRAQRLINTTNMRNLAEEIWAITRTPKELEVNLIESILGAIATELGVDSLDNIDISCVYDDIALLNELDERGIEKLIEEVTEQYQALLTVTYTDATQRGFFHDNLKDALAAIAEQSMVLSYTLSISY